MSTLIETIKGYAVKMPNTGNLASNGDGLPRVFRKLRKAGSYRDELIPHIGRGKVVRVAVQVPAILEARAIKIEAEIIGVSASRGANTSSDRIPGHKEGSK